MARGQLWIVRGSLPPLVVNHSNERLQFSARCWRTSNAHTRSQMRSGVWCQAQDGITVSSCIVRLPRRGASSLVNFPWGSGPGAFAIRKQDGCICITRLPPPIRRSGCVCAPDCLDSTPHTYLRTICKEHRRQFAQGHADMVQLRQAPSWAANGIGVFYPCVNNPPINIDTA